MGGNLAAWAIDVIGQKAHRVIGPVGRGLNDAVRNLIFRQYREQTTVRGPVNCGVTVSPPQSLSSTHRHPACELTPGSATTMSMLSDVQTHQPRGVHCQATSHPQSHVPRPTAWANSQDGRTRRIVA